MDDPAEELQAFHDFTPATAGQKIGLAVFILTCLAATIVALFQ
jgi:hypothetical protein